MIFDDNGNLAGGIIKDKNLADVYQHLVTPFANSITRERNYNSLLSFLEDLKEDKQMISKIWLDGSFCTNKENPNDIDMIVFIKPSLNGNVLLESISQNHAIMKENHLDIYPCFDKVHLNTNEFSNQIEFNQTFSQMDWQEKYWMGQFGFDRNQNHKAILELMLDGGDTLG